MQEFRMIKKRFILPAIVVSQFFCTSLWFAGNAIMPDIVKRFGIDPGYLAHLASAVQFGFITGTLVFAILTIADRFSPSKIFFICSLIAAACNMVISIPGISVSVLLLSRFLTGFFLAGIYPVGMKIASDHFQQGLGRSLGFLVGALVLGTAFPHLLKSLAANLPWKFVIYTISALSVCGGMVMLLLVPDGPYRKAGQKMKAGSFMKAFANKNFRAAASGYFGHMWELYTFWAFVPVMLAANEQLHHQKFNISLLSFCIIASGSLACVAGGYISQKIGARKVATGALFLSGMCCLLSPLFLFSSSPVVLAAFLFFWGMVVVTDSPMFSTLVAQTVPEESRGTALTMVNCIGFSITIISIQFTRMLSEHFDARYLYLFLAIGPLAGLIALLKEDRAN